MRLAAAIALALATACFGFAACKGKPVVLDTLCDPGENIFCRCPNGKPGTHLCEPDGASFAACVTFDGPCSDIDPNGVGGGGAGGSSGSMGEGGGTAVVTRSILEPCALAANCASGVCRGGYCTTPCESASECDKGSCVALDGQSVCMPSCAQDSDCWGTYGHPSECGFTRTVDSHPVTVCADWSDELAVPPPGTPCGNHVECDLGHSGLSNVCVGNKCEHGCYVNFDCPPGSTCSSTGDLGLCVQSSP